MKRGAHMQRRTFRDLPVRRGKAFINARVGNMMINGAGAETLQDRGSHARGADTLNPYFSANAQYRWQEYARWYATSWEAKKIMALVALIIEIV